MSICPSDGLVFLSPRWPKDRYLQFYQTEYDTYYRPEVTSEQTDDSKYRNIKQICARLKNLELVEGRTSALDVGAGMGWSLHWLQQTYPSIQRLGAIESSQHCITNLKSVVGAKVLSDDIDGDWTSPGFDLVILRHVLEHFMNPIDALKKVRTNLTPDGVVYIAVPDMMNPSGSLNHYWYRTVHTYYFSKETLTAVATMAGLQPLDIRNESSELWGVFVRRNEPVHQVDIDPEMYRRQLAVIEDHKSNTRLLDIKFEVKKVLKSVLGR